MIGTRRWTSFFAVSIKPPRMTVWPLKALIVVIACDTVDDRGVHVPGRSVENPKSERRLPVETCDLLALICITTSPSGLIRGINFQNQTDLTVDNRVGLAECRFD